MKETQPIHNMHARTHTPTTKSSNNFTKKNKKKKSSNKTYLINF